MEIFGSLGTPLLFVVKVAIWLFLVLYVLFAAVVIRQVRVMIETLQVGLEKPLKGIALIHLIFSVTVFVLSLFIL
ncbi:hypothetical protein A2714_05115 [Candidatus Woesebacteria bacterium RIFCSPHIGHO2_01_FULL_38_9]|uniref:Uncharacterized protein n=2 Tax=Candidatus Woeseibacteriota TaxID=1752722 RepID=A0A1F7Y187_9BACT|nr:MAG: hypothetical protein A2714_05115 [Candidatus Woesebacteria bacterium RIFCSPHIGHO2_01_FULL_38_9]OGM59178.1 MAG: hypothetical protein A3A75_03090 [Candidatus Woesebacteria bacterium RIFCSPLOWO2_01_FULL_39_10]